MVMFAGVSAIVIVTELYICCHLLLAALPGWLSEKSEAKTDAKRDGAERRKREKKRKQKAYAICYMKRALWASYMVIMKRVYFICRCYIWCYFCRLLTSAIEHPRCPTPCLRMMRKSAIADCRRYDAMRCYWDAILSDAY